jgi:hypothetical protein
MDHHCPWLANCLGLHNYKAFLLFLIYTSLFCIVCFATSCKLVYTELFNATTGQRNSQLDDLAPVNWVLLAVISGIVGLVLSGFTTWHLILTSNNMTTIESLEKVRYTAPSIRNGAAPAGAHSLGAYDYDHEYNRYGNYLLEESSKKLPHAFNLGTKRNFAQVFGGRDKMLLWLFPVFTGIGDGWNWETSKEWREAALALKAERDKWLKDQRDRERAAGWGYDPEEERAWNQRNARGNPQGLIQHAGRSKADKLLGRTPGGYTDYLDTGVPMKKLKKKPVSIHDISDDDEEEDGDDAAAGVEKETEPLNGKKKDDDKEDVEWGTWG